MKTEPNVLCFCDPEGRNLELDDWATRANWGDPTSQEPEVERTEVGVGWKVGAPEK